MSKKETLACSTAVCLANKKRNEIVYHDHDDDAEELKRHMDSASKHDSPNTCEYLLIIRIQKKSKAAASQYERG